MDGTTEFQRGIAVSHGAPAAEPTHRYARKPEPFIFTNGRLTGTDGTGPSTPPWQNPNQAGPAGSDARPSPRTTPCSDRPSSP